MTAEQFLPFSEKYSRIHSITFSFVCFASKAIFYSFLFAMGAFRSTHREDSDEPHSVYTA